MRIGILTFHFAYNYGAMLQAFALKSFLCKQGYHAEIIPYFPSNFKKCYRISPFIRGISCRRRISNAVRYLQRMKQARLFETFKDEQLYSQSHKEFDERNRVKDILSSYDAIIYGSDQIWNTDISFNDPIYWGAEYNKMKISYAASMGRKCVVPNQEKLLHNLRAFYALSVREPESQSIISSKCGTQSQIVCDPVFLCSRAEWEEEENVINVSQPYVLLYLLQENCELQKYTLLYAQKRGYKIYSIHPTQSIYPKGTEPLRMVGPREFLYLVNHAQCVSTNSFHCVAFSVLFKKHLIHIPSRNSPERTTYLLKMLDVLPTNGLYDVSPNEVNFSSINELISDSKFYLKEVLRTL